MNEMNIKYTILNIRQQTQNLFFSLLIKQNAQNVIFHTIFTLEIFIKNKTYFCSVGFIYVQISNY